MFKSSWNPFKKEDPKELVRKWKANIRTEIRNTDREINYLIKEQKKAAVAIKDAAKRNDMVSARMLAKEVVRLRTAVARLAGNKAAMMSLSNEMTQTLAIAKVAGSIKSSTQVMTSMNNLIKVPELQKTMKEMAKEMARAGFIQNMVSESIDSAVDTDDAEEAAAEEVDQVLLEITGETMAQLAAVPSGKMQQKVVEEADDDLMERLAELRVAQ